LIRPAALGPTGARAPALLRKAQLYIPWAVSLPEFGSTEPNSGVRTALRIPFLGAHCSWRAPCKESPVLCMRPSY
jgi:hypothetical protein